MLSFWHIYIRFFFKQWKTVNYCQVDLCKLFLRTIKENCIFVHICSEKVFTMMDSLCMLNPVATSDSEEKQKQGSAFCIKTYFAISFLGQNCTANLSWKLCNIIPYIRYVVSQRIEQKYLIYFLKLIRTMQQNYVQLEEQFVQNYRLNYKHFNLPKIFVKLLNYVQFNTF